MEKIWSDLAFLVVGFCWALHISKGILYKRKATPHQTHLPHYSFLTSPLFFSPSTPPSLSLKLYLYLSISRAAMAIATDTQFHVLAVDDSLSDRKLIERLLKTSSYQGKFSWHPSFFFFCDFSGVFWVDFSLLGSVTTVDSGTKALELLGLQDDQTNTLSYPTNQQVTKITRTNQLFFVDLLLAE